MSRHFLSTILLGVFLLGLAFSTAVAQTNERGIDPRNFDTTISPCSDFYEYVNGTWLKNNPIPAAYASWGVDDEVRQRNANLLKEILESAAANTSAPKGSNLQKIGDFYAVAIDTVALDAKGTADIKKELDQIAVIASIADLQNVIMDFHNSGIGALFGAGALQDMKDNTQVIAYAVEGGLSLPDRDYYLRTDDESKALREQYVNHIAAMLALLGDTPENAKTEASAIMNIETLLAEASLTNVEKRDPANYYNIMTVKEADQKTPNFSWSLYFKNIGHPEIERFSYAQPKFFARMDSLLSSVPLADWKNYLRWNVVHGFAPYLSSPFVNENFKFYGTTLSGSKELRPRWRRVLNTINGNIGEALGQLFVERVFPPSYKARAIEMINNLKTAFKDRIMKLDWMSDSTKQRALEKLAAFGVKVGYPDKWRDYSTLEISRDSYIANIRNSQAFEVRRNWNKIGKPVDKTEWGMVPQEVNAYYSPLQNEIVFPAAILQPPYFDGDIDDAVNYGAMGATIGHEMTHGFDNHGCMFDAEGNMKNWWSESDFKEFETRSARLAEQYDNFVAIDSLHVNGKLCLGEEIGDLGGMLISYDALQMALAGKEQKKIDGFTPEQRFFLSFAQEWRTNFRPEMLKLLVNSDEHPPGKFRVLGTLANMPAFYEAFGCKAGDSMTRNDSDIVRIW
jgi:putative endopeptidase